MKKLIVILIISICLLHTTPALAGGDKVRGDAGQGSVVQQQVSGNPYERRP